MISLLASSEMSIALPWLVDLTHADNSWQQWPLQCRFVSACQSACRDVEVGMQVSTGNQRRAMHKHVIRVSITRFWHSLQTCAIRLAVCRACIITIHSLNRGMVNSPMRRNTVSGGHHRASAQIRSPVASCSKLGSSGMLLNWLRRNGTEDVCICP